MSTDWFGVLLSIPIGIATGLATPWLQRKLEERGKQRALVRFHHAKAEYEAVSFYKEHPQEFTQFLVQVAIKTTFIGALMGALSGFSFVLAQLADATNLGIGYPRLLQTFLYAGGQFVALMGSLMIVNICRPALTTWTRVRNYEEYKAAIERVISLDKT